jgi:hypothetical protein
MSDERQLAVDLFNGTWDLLRAEHRTPAQDAEMVHMAHASCFHWSRVGTAVNVARGEWQVSRVYSVLGRGEPALWHARRCLALCTEHGSDDWADWDLAFAHEAMARAYDVAGDDAERDRHLALAREVPIADDADRELLLQDLATIGG